MDDINLPNNIYYDANIINSDQSGNKPPPRLIFQDIRSLPILSSPELYQLSVVRFNLQTANSLPVFIPNIQVNNYNSNLTTYSFTLTFYNIDDETYTSAQTFCSHIPANLNLPIPNLTNSTDVRSPYYYVYSFNTIVEMFNDALAQAFTTLTEVAGFAGVTLPTTNPPFFEWDSDNQKFILNGDVVGFNDKNASHISIACNTALYTLISGFRADYNGPDIYLGRNYVLRLSRETRGLNLFKIDNTYSVIQSYQEYSSGALFTPVSSIVFSTSLIPVLPSNVAKPTIFDGDGSLVSTGNNNNITSMITDFESQDNNGYGFQGILSYTPTAEYRMIDLNNSSSEKLNNLDVSVYWKDQYSNLHPVYLLPGCSCNIKILFRKKQL